MYRKLKRARFAARVKKVVNKMAETKFYQFGYENQELYHDVGKGVGPTTNQHAIIFNPWALIGQGTAQHNRVGDTITPRSFIMRLWLANKADRCNVIYRVIVCRLPKVLAGVQLNGVNIDIFRADDAGTNGNTLCAMIDNDKGVRAYYDRLHRLEHGQSYTLNAAGTGWVGRESHKLVRLKIKRKRSRLIRYTPAGDIVNNPIGIYVIPYDSYGTLQTDNVGSCAFTCRMYYKDI